MRLVEVKKTIPIALKELKASSYRGAELEELCLQVTSHDERYMARRGAIRKVLGLLHIDLAELPSWQSHPGRVMRPALLELMESGEIARMQGNGDGEDVPPYEYYLVNPVVTATTAE